jgi:aryl-alcohol dehydrogenase-like predicted oxidoreductase
MGMICFSPLAGGFLTGKYRKDTPPPDSVRQSFVGQYLNERGWRLLDGLDTVAGDHSTTVAAVSLAWILAQRGVTAPVVGANSVAQLEGWAAAPTVNLDADEVARLSALGWDGSEPEFVAW